MLNVRPAHPGGEAAPHQGAVWFDLLAANEAEARLVEDHTGLKLPSRDDLGQIEQSSRLAFDNGVLRLAAPVIAQSDTDHPSLSHIGLILTPQLLISVRYEPLKMFQAVADRACGGDGPVSSTGVFAALMEAFVARQADLLEEARSRLDVVSHGVFRKSSTNPRRAAPATAAMRERLQTIGRIGERVSMIRESLLAVDRMIPFALEQAKPWFAPELAQRLAAVRDDIASLNMFEEHLSNKVQFMLDAVLGFIGIEQNDVFKVLTIASVVGIFPTLVAGWYGMNFHNMPEYGWTFGYQYGVAAIVLSAALPLAWFKWRGWM
jgi:magnesium transporter